MYIKGLCHVDIAVFGQFYAEVIMPSPIYKLLL